MIFLNPKCLLKGLGLQITLKRVEMVVERIRVEGHLGKDSNYTFFFTKISLAINKFVICCFIISLLQNLSTKHSACFNVKNTREKISCSNDQIQRK